MSTVNAETLTSINANKSVTVVQLYDKVNETTPKFTGVVSPTGKTATIDAIVDKVNADTQLFTTKTASFVAVSGGAYRMVTQGITATLPLGSTLTKGASIRFSKLAAITVVIQAVSTNTITINSKVGDSVLFDDNIEFVIVWNGTGWEI